MKQAGWAAFAAAAMMLVLAACGGGGTVEDKPDLSPEAERAARMAEQELEKGLDAVTVRKIIKDDPGPQGPPACVAAGDGRVFTKPDQVRQEIRRAWVDGVWHRKAGHRPPVDFVEKWLLRPGAVAKLSAADRAYLAAPVSAAAEIFGLVWSGSGTLAPTLKPPAPAP